MLVPQRSSPFILHLMGSFKANFGPLMGNQSLSPDVNLSAADFFTHWSLVTSEGDWVPKPGQVTPLKSDPETSSPECMNHQTTLFLL